MEMIMVQDELAHTHVVYVLIVHPPPPSPKTEW